jgi:Ca2+-binding EF-hand superfamily protein
MVKHNFVKAKSPGNLLRYQFLEVIIRIACGRCDAASVGEVGAVSEFLTTFLVPDAKEIKTGHETFLESLFTEENDVVMKDNLEMLRVVYDVFRQQKSLPGLQGSLSHASFVSVLDELKCYDNNCTKNAAPLSWPVGKVMVMDEYDGQDHLVMNFNEFMIALAFIVYMRDDFDEKTFSDNLEIFFLDFVTPLYSKVVTLAANADEDAAMKPIVSVIVEMFFEADAKMSGTINRRDFMRVYESPTYLDKMQKLGFSEGVVKDLFTRFETDGDWRVSPDKLIESLVKIKTSTKGMEKVLAFLKVVFELADADGSGELDRKEFDQAFSSESVKQDLLRIGIDPDDVTSLFQEIDKDKSGSVSLDELTRGFIELRNPSKAHENLMQTIERFFAEYSDESLSAQQLRNVMISRPRFRNFWLKDNVQRKIRKFKELPDPDRLYDMIDTENSRSITVEMMLHGLSPILKSFAAR